MSHALQNDTEHMTFVSAFEYSKCLKPLKLPKCHKIHHMLEIWTVKGHANYSSVATKVEPKPLYFLCQLPKPVSAWVISKYMVEFTFLGLNCH